VHTVVVRLQRGLEHGFCGLRAVLISLPDALIGLKRLLPVGVEVELGRVVGRRLMRQLRVRH